MFVKTQGVIWPHGRGVTLLVEQVDVKSMKKKEKVRGTVKLARFCGNNLTKDLIIGSCFDQNPFYILTNAAEKVTWDVVTRQVYSKAKDKKVPFQFLFWSLSNTYNHEMNVRRLAGGPNVSSLELRHCIRIPLRKKKDFLLRQLSLVLLAILKVLAPLGAGVSVIAPLPERLLGLIGGSLWPQSSLEYMCLVVISLCSSPLGLRTAHIRQNHN